MARGTTRPAEVRLVRDAAGADALARVCDAVWGGAGLVPVPLVVAAIHVARVGRRGAIVGSPSASAVCLGDEA